MIDKTDWPAVEDKAGSLEYLPTERSRKWRFAHHRPRIVRAIAEPEARQLCKHYGYYAFRYVTGQSF